MGGDIARTGGSQKRTGSPPSVKYSGISYESIYSEKAHKIERENKINLLGGTHYSSEKFACIAMCKYFEKLGLKAEFIPDVHCYKDT